MAGGGEGEDEVGNREIADEHETKKEENTRNDNNREREEYFKKTRKKEKKCSRENMQIEQPLAIKTPLVRTGRLGHGHNIRHDVVLLKAPVVLA